VLEAYLGCIVKEAQTPDFQIYLMNAIVAGKIINDKVFDYLQTVQFKYYSQIIIPILVGGLLVSVRTEEVTFINPRGATKLQRASILQRWSDFARQDQIYVT
jgi:hypothetical protein